MLQVIGRKEKYFKNANNFVPERWLDKEDRPGTAFAYAPFGIGVRSCVGKRVAEQEMTCLITEVTKIVLLLSIT